MSSLPVPEATLPVPEATLPDHEAQHLEAIKARLYELLKIVPDCEHMFDELKKEEWRPLPNVRDSPAIWLKAIYEISTEGTPPPSAEKRTDIEELAKRIFNSLLYARAYINIILLGGEYDKEGDFDTWTSFFKTLEGTEWRMIDWKTLVTCFLRDSRYNKEKMKVMKEWPEYQKVSPLFGILEMLIETYVLTFDSLSLVHDEVENGMAKLLRKKRKLEDLIEKEESFLSTAAI